MFLQNFTMKHIRYFKIHKCTNNGNINQLKKNYKKFNDQRILELCDEFVPGDPPEYFFDKNPENFSAILTLHRSVNIFKTEDSLIWEIYSSNSSKLLWIILKFEILSRNGFLHISENGCALVLQVPKIMCITLGYFKCFRNLGIS